jgi:hypothetical protein
VATENIRDRFRRWRRVRPFWGGLLLVLSGLEMFVSANMELDNIKIHIGPQGFYSYLLPVMMIAAGILTWLSPAQRLFYGVIGIITALYSFIGLNLGGWIAGMLLGIVGGALVIAWGPPRVAPPRDERPTQEIEPVADEQPSGVQRKALLIVAPLLLATSVMVAGNRPAEAADCPEGLPSRKTSPSATATSAAKVKPKPKPTKTASGPSPSTSVSPSASPSQTGSGNPVLDGINDFWNGVGDFLGIGGEEQAEPSPAPSAGAPGPGPSAQPTTAAPGTGPSASVPASPSASASVPPSASASAKPEEIPCLGARQMNVRADDGGIPLAGAKPGVVRAASVTMYNSSYDGVAEVPTGNGPIRSLKFTMDKVVNKPFTLTIDEPGDAVTVIESGELILDGNVEFYSPTFKGKLFGLIPVTFTPEQPPPLTLPVLWFTDVTLDLAYVSSDVLTAKPLDIEGTAAG